jgi:DNA uptake protein ComE-like DNA-binding protein
MKAPTAAAILLLACCTAWAADPPKADAKAASKADTRSDFLRSESVKAEPKAPSNLRLNLNAAKAAELERLPGVDAARARAIIKGRPYKSKEELVTKQILPQVVYEEMKGNVFAGR